MLFVTSAGGILIFSFLSFNSRLHSNNLNCDCHLAWLAQWLRQRPTVGLFTQCTGPPELRGLNVAEVQKHEFSCSGKIYVRLKHWTLKIVWQHNFSTQCEQVFFPPQEFRAGIKWSHLLTFPLLITSKNHKKVCCTWVLNLDPGRTLLSLVFCPTLLFPVCFCVIVYSPSSHLTTPLPQSNPTALLWPLHVYPVAGCERKKMPIICIKHIAGAAAATSPQVSLFTISHLLAEGLLWL